MTENLDIASKTRKNKLKKGRPAYVRWLVLAAGLGFAATLGIVASVIGAFYYVAPGLPPAETIREIPLQIPLRIFSRDGRLIDEVGERRRTPITYADLPKHVIDAFVAAEDRRFFVHPGVDYQGILRAGWLLAKTGEISGGGSTLTQQLARDYFLTREQIFTRKIREAFLAYKIEQEFSKQEILALFLNKMFFGQRAYGVAAAAQVYFGKNLADVNAAEAATLAGVLPAPSDYNPVTSAKKAAVRRGYVLGRMHDLDFLTDVQYADATNFPVESRLHGTASELLAPYVGEMVRQEMIKRFGEKATYSSGYKVVTTLDSTMQTAANYSLRNGLLEFTRRRGFRGAIARTEVTPEVLQQDYANWPEELQLHLGDHNNPGSLMVAVVTAIDEESNNAEVVLQTGERVSLPWHGIDWANPYFDPESFGPAPKTVAEVLLPGDFVYVMPITIGGYALAQLPLAQSALVSVDPNDGAITALAGGYDFTISKFNRVTQAIRQPGSSFKPFTYAAALHNGNSLATIVADLPVVINSAALERLWRPINYSGRFYGPQRVREALIKSMNLASVRLLLDHTGIGNTVRYLAPFGFNEGALPRNGSLALGGGNATPLDMAQAYSVFANGGYSVQPYVIDSITDATDKIVYRANPATVCRECEISKPQKFGSTPVVRSATPMRRDTRQLLDNADNPESANDDAAIAEAQSPIDLFPGVDVELLSLDQLAVLAESYRPNANEAPKLFTDVNVAPRIISEQIAYLIQDAMRDVIRRGTGIRAWRALGRNDLSGKTGTSNDGRDAWFAGFNSDMVGIVWVGYDDHKPLGPREEGSRTALPIWNQFMLRVISGRPLAAMPVPDGIITVRINKKTGCPATASDPLEQVMFEKFREDNVPECDMAIDPINLFNSSDDADDEDTTDELLQEGEEAEEQPKPDDSLF